MTNNNNRHDKKPARKANVYVYRTLPTKCPSCKLPIKKAEYIGRNNKVMKADLATCERCKKTYVSLWFYYKNRHRLNSLNPKETDRYIQEDQEDYKRRKALRDALYEKVIIQKEQIYEKVLPVLDSGYGFDIEAFRKELIHTAVEADTLIVAIIIKESSHKKNKGKYFCVFISDSNNVDKLKKSTDSGFTVVNTNNQIANRAIASIKSGYMYFLLRGQRYSVCNTVVLNSDKFRKLINESVCHDEYFRIRTPKPINKTEIVNYVAPVKRKAVEDEERYVYVYYSLENVCMKKKHNIESVTAKTTNIKNGQPVEVNVYYCNDCDKYFINFEALQLYISRGIYPALLYIFSCVDENKLNDASELMMYGYSVKEGISQQERRHVLEWVIDSGLMSKSEIIRNIQFKVKYNGSKAGNERARQKWLDDIQYVSHYVVGNKREIKPVFIFKK